MWWLLKTMYFLHIFGNAFCLFDKHPVNPEAKINVSQIITHWNYPSEVHKISTEDGYILQLNRIPHGKNNSSQSASRPVVFLQHGLLTSASMWISNLPHNSLAFILADAGCDVWMGNSRGSTWSKKHLYLDIKSKAYWAFSYDHLAQYDLPANIDYIVNKTGQDQIYYVGHSQGTLIAFAGFSINTQLVKKIKIFFALAPVITVKHISGFLRITEVILPELFKTLFGEKEFLPHTFIDKILGQRVCNHDVIDTICTKFIYSLFGYNPKNINESHLDVYLTQNPSGTSVQTMLHYLQTFKSKTFRAYDFGNTLENILHYNQSDPPVYDIKNMNVQTAIWSGGQDTVADPIDVENLTLNLRHLIYHKKISLYAHHDFVIGLDAYEQVYCEIVKMIKKNG